MTTEGCAEEPAQYIFSELLPLLQAPPSREAEERGTDAFTVLLPALGAVRRVEVPRGVWRDAAIASI